MPRAILPVTRLFLCVLFLGGGCKFYTAGNPYDANLADAESAECTGCWAPGPGHRPAVLWRPPLL